MSLPEPSQQAIAALAPTGVLRAGINLRNFLLVTDTADNGDPMGVSPDLAAKLAQQLDVGLQLIGYATPAEISDTAANDEWDIGNIGATAIRAETIAFTEAYAEIEATFMVRGDSPLKEIADVDAPGVRIAVSGRTAYDNWLEKNIQHAELIRAEGNEATFQLFVGRELEAMAGLRPGLMGQAESLPGARLLPGRFAAVQQAVGTPKHRDPAGAAYLAEFVAAIRDSGLIAELIDLHEVQGRLVPAGGAEA